MMRFTGSPRKLRAEPLRKVSLWTRTPCRTLRKSNKFGKVSGEPWQTGLVALESFGTNFFVFKTWD